MQFILENIIIPLISSISVVVGGAIPVSILIYSFSVKEKKRLLAHADMLKKALPIQEQLYERMAELVRKSVNEKDVNKGLDQFSQLIEAQNTIDSNKKFIKYAENYNFISAVGHILRMSNYIPKNIQEHKENSKNLPDPSSKDT